MCVSIVRLDTGIIPENPSGTVRLVGRSNFAPNKQIGEVKQRGRFNAGGLVRRAHDLLRLRALAPLVS
jgi:hypothetical protein